jgi:hypothetical protein
MGLYSMKQWMYECMQTDLIWPRIAFAVRVYSVEKFSVTNCNQIVKTVLMSNDMRLSELHYLSGLGPWQMLFILISRQLS